MLKTVAESIGKGIVAGLAGTAAMTVSSTLEMKLQGREASTAPAKAAGKVLGVQPRNPEGEARFSQVVHWSYGTGWGVARGLLGASGLGSAAAGATHFATVWGSAQVVLPALDVAPPAWEWDAETVALDVLHHAVYAAATGWAYDRLEGAGREAQQRAWRLPGR
jgi:hypothetical protein